MNCSYSGNGLETQYGYRINGPNGDPDIRRENRYCRLPNSYDISDSNFTNIYGPLWTYGTGKAFPIGFSPSIHQTGCILNNKRYVISSDIYKKPVGTVSSSYLESEFTPPIATPEEAKLIQGSQTLGNR